MLSKFIIYLTRKLKQLTEYQKSRLTKRFSRNADKREAAYQAEARQKQEALVVYNNLKAQATECRKACCNKIQEDSAKVMVELSELSNL